MGLIKAAASAIGSTLHDQWKDLIKCEDMKNDVLMVRKSTANGVITEKSAIIVEPGQMAVICDNGKVLDATFEPGQYTYDMNTSPSFFSGSFAGPFKEMWQRFTYGGVAAKSQAVYFFNMKEIFDNKFGTPNPIPYQDWGHMLYNGRDNTYYPLSVYIKCFGKYTFQIEDPALFMSKVAGTAEVYTKETLVEQIRTEVISAFTNILSSLGNEENKIKAMDLPNKPDEIRAIMEAENFDSPIRERGIKLVSFAIESTTFDDESKKKIDQFEIGGDAFQQKGVLTESYGDAVKSAASNSGGAMSGFMGVGMMNMGAGGAFNQVNSNDQMSEQIKARDAGSQAEEQVSTSKWKCSCGTENEGKFCSECGASKDKKCPKCETANEAGTKFCKECGEKL